LTLNYIKVASIKELPAGQTKRISPMKGEYLLLCNVEGEFYAIDDFCTHDGAILGFSELYGCEVECPRHYARFDVKTGAALTAPARTPVRTFPVRVTGEDVEVGMEERREYKAGRK
jgi:3-phenylpropionate/trans-cinnamate dioxygenase ferredoxin subunit